MILCHPTFIPVCSKEAKGFEDITKLFSSTFNTLITIFMEDDILDTIRYTKALLCLVSLLFEYHFLPQFEFISLPVDPKDCRAIALQYLIPLSVVLEISRKRKKMSKKSGLFFLL